MGDAPTADAVAAFWSPLGLTAEGERAAYAARVAPLIEGLARATEETRESVLVVLVSKLKCVRMLVL